MHSSIENTALTASEDLPRNEDPPPKVVADEISGRGSGLGTGILLAGGALVGCFALALWNRKALMALVRNRGLRREPVRPDAAQDADEID